MRIALTTEFNSIEEMTGFLANIAGQDLAKTITNEPPAIGDEKPEPATPETPKTGTIETKELIPEGGKKRGRPAKKPPAEPTEKEIAAAKAKEEKKAEKAHEKALKTVREWVLADTAPRKKALKSVFPEGKSKLTMLDINELEQIIEDLEIPYEKK